MSASSEAKNPTLTDAIAENIDSFKKRHSNFPHEIYSQQKISDFLKDRFSAEVFRAFSTLKPYAYKADLAKYCILYEFGGIYADLSIFFFQTLPLDPERITVFRDFPWSSPWDTSNGLISSPPKHKVFEHAIELVCANVKRGYYGSTPLCPTGPALFGKALAVTCEAEEILTGASFFLERDILKRATPKLALPRGKKVHCYKLGRTLIAVKRKSVGSPGLVDLGVVDGNSYSELWKNRDIYGVDNLDSWPFKIDAHD